MRNVRNWWLDLTVDGRASDVSTGPTGKDGGFMLTIKQRDGDEPSEVLTVWAKAARDGTLQLIVQDGKGNVVHKHVTDRIEKGQLVE